MTTPLPAVPPPGPPTPPPQPIRFFVFHIESPGAPDLYHNRREGDALQRISTLHDIPCVCRLTINGQAFVAALKLGLPEAMAEYPQRLPIIHISAHGDAEGVYLSDGSRLSWSQLRDLLTPVNQSLSDRLILCLSSCESFAGIRMAMHADEPAPYFAIVGTFKKPTWVEATVAYTVFYHQLSRLKTIPEAVQAMVLASDHDGWMFEMAATIKQQWIEALKSVNLQNAQAELIADAENSDISPEAKSLEADGEPGATVPPTAP
jgi:hypothetical protein